jgi:hypothetical protein
VATLELTAHARTGSLSCCHGFDVAAGDGPVGRVETPIFSGTGLEPHSLLLRTVNTIPGTFAAVAASRVVSVDETAKSITLDGTRDELFGDAGSGETGLGTRDD